MTTHNSPYDLTSVPTEIWQDILARACTDGGSTGKSLILTSKFFHAQANDSRFTSLALFSLHQLERFLAFVRSRPSEWRYSVRHLWLSFLHENFKGSVLSVHDESEMEWYARFDRAMNDLLALVAPALRTLTLSQSYSHALPSFRLDLPMLEELTVWGSISAVVVVHPHPVDCAPRLPALRRFHFVCSDPSTRTHLLASSSWLSASPLTHLRLSDLNGGDEEHGFANTLAHAIGAHKPGRGWSNSVPPEGKEIIFPMIFPHLRHLWIYGTEYHGTCTDSDLEWEDLKPKLQEVVRVAAEERGTWALVMEKSWRKKKMWEGRLWDDWLDRMEGGRGCWVESEEDEKALEGPDICKPYEGGHIWD